MLGQKLDNVTNKYDEVAQDFANIKSTYLKYVSMDEIQAMRNDSDYVKLERYIISKEHATMLYQQMKDTDEILKKHKIEYWLAFGSLLGAIRHGGQIAFDDDLDIIVPSKYEEKLHGILHEFEELGYKTKISEGGHWYYIYNDNMPGMDIFIMQDNGDKFHLKSEKALNHWPKCWFDKESIYPLKKHKFGDLELQVPQEYDDYLTRCYSKDWKSVMMFKGNHVLKYIGQKLKIEIKKGESLLQPATPFGPLLDRVH